MFEETVEWLSAQRRPHPDVFKLQDDILLSFYDEPVWEAWKMFARDEKFCQLEVKAVVSPQTRRLRDVEAALWRAWRGFGNERYSVTSLHEYANAMVLRFVLANPRSKVYMPGRFVAGGPHYQDLVRMRRRRRFREQCGNAPLQIDWTEVCLSGEQEEETEQRIAQQDIDDDNLVLARIIDVLTWIDQYRNLLDDAVVRQARCSIWTEWTCYWGVCISRFGLEQACGSIVAIRKCRQRKSPK